MEWRTAGLSWADGEPVLGWERGPQSAGGGAARRVPGRRTAGVRRGAGESVPRSPPSCRGGGRRPGAPSARGSTGRTRWPPTPIADDPRTYRVYLAWFGPGMVKVGITARGARGRAAARAGGRGVLLAGAGAADGGAAGRGAAAGRARGAGPDPVRPEAGGRAALPAGGERAAGAGAELHGAAVALDGWPESLERLPWEVVDHAEVFGMDRLRGAGRVRGDGTRRRRGGRGELVAAAGPDLHLVTRRGLSCSTAGCCGGGELVVADAGGRRRGRSEPIGALSAGGRSAQDGLSVPAQPASRAAPQAAAASRGARRSDAERRASSRMVKSRFPYGNEAGKGWTARRRAAESEGHE